MNPGLSRLHAYPFEKLAELRSRTENSCEFPLINLSIGEPQHETPAFIRDALTQHLEGTAKYPGTRGLPELRESIQRWLVSRFKLPSPSVCAEKNILPVNGTREALFAIAQTVFSRSKQKPLIGMPNPFYQIYEGAALLAGAEPYYFPAAPDSTQRPLWNEIPESVWPQCALVYVCSPANPSGYVLTADDYAFLTAKADRYDFVIVADECYSELYLDELAPPVGLLQWCAQAGRPNYSRCLVMHSLSKRSNAPGLRSGFVAGDADLIETFFRYRTYQGGAMPLPTQFASIAAWSDETHVRENRRLYQEKFSRVVPILNRTLSVSAPAAGFYLWPEVPTDDLIVCQQLLAEAAVLTLPGSFLSRDAHGQNPGQGRIRIALVPPANQCVEAAERMHRVFAKL